MLINKDLNAVIRRGKWITREKLEQQLDAGIILSVCLVCAMVIFLVTLADKL